MNLQLYATCAAEAWAPGFGDRDIYGIVMTIAYFAAAVLAVTVVFRGPFRHEAQGSERALWTLGAAILVALAVNKQLDLQSMVVAGVRCVAQAEGWYETRRAFQARVILVLLIAAAVVIPLLVLILRRSVRGNLAFVLSLSLLVVFVAVRAISLHRLDALFGAEFLMLRLHRTIEVAGLGLVLLSSARRIARPGSR